MRQIYVALLGLACAGAQAATYELTLTNPSFSVIDITPGDQFMPSYTVNAAGLLDLLTPVDYHDKGGVFEGNTVLPPSAGPDGARIIGALGPGTQLIWKATGHLKLSVIDTGDYNWEADGIRIQTSFYSTDILEHFDGFELHYQLGGGQGTYQRLTEDHDFSVELHATNPSDVPQGYLIGWFNQYQIESYKIPFPVTPVPEPEEYAMLLAGLGLVGAVVRRRKQKAIAA